MQDYRPGSVITAVIPLSTAKRTPRMSENIVVNKLDARCIRLVNSKGQPRITMTSSAPESGAELTLFSIFDDNGKPRLELQVCGDETGIRISDACGNVSISIGSRSEGGGFVINDSDGIGGIVAGVSSAEDRDPDGNIPKPRLEIRDRESGKTWRAQDDFDA